MREIRSSQITEAVAGLLVAAVHELPADVLEAIRAASSREHDPVARHVFDQIIANAELAKAEDIPLCQDTGSPVVFIELGQDVVVTGGGLGDAVDDGVAQAATDGYLRRSIVEEPLFERRNTGTNTPAFLHLESVPGDSVRIAVIPKGGGCENMSVLRMLKPAQGLPGVRDLVLQVIEEGAVNSCAPLIVGVGVGGTFDTVGWTSKKALLRKVGQPHPDPRVASLERELLSAINDTGIGAMGWGGGVTALAVHVETAPTHIASLPVAINMQCHSARHKQVIL